MAHEGEDCEDGKDFDGNAAGGALMQLYLATSDPPPLVNGGYYVPVATEQSLIYTLLQTILDCKGSHGNKAIFEEMCESNWLSPYLTLPHCA
jgi:hypothetical protein